VVSLISHGNGLVSVQARTPIVPWRRPCPSGVHACAARSVFDRFRAIAHEGEVDKRVQFTIEELYRVRARGFEAEGFAAVLPTLDLVRRRHVVYATYKSMIHGLACRSAGHECLDAERHVACAAEDALVAETGRPSRAALTHGFP